MRAMSVLRLTLAGLVFMLLVLACAVVYTFQHLPQLLEQQAAAQLSGYGVQHVSVDELTLSSDSLSATRIEIRGERDGASFTVTVHAPELRYHWRAALKGRAQSLHIARLEAALEASPRPSSNAAASTIDTGALLPQDYRALLPLERLEVAHWVLNYRANGDAILRASGQLLLAQQLKLQIDAAVSGLRSVATLTSSGTDTLQLNAEIAANGESTGTVNATLERAPTADQTDTHSIAWRVEGDLHHQPLLLWLQREQTPIDADLRDRLQRLALAGSTGFVARAQHHGVLRLGQASGDNLAAQVQLSIDAHHNIVAAGYRPFLQAVHGSFDSSATITGGTLRAALSNLDLSGQMLADATGITDETLASLRWAEQIPLSLHVPGSVDLTAAADATQTLRANGAWLALGNSPTTVRLESLDLEADAVYAGDDRDSANTRASAAGTLALTLRNTVLPALHFTLQQRGDVQTSAVTMQLSDLKEQFGLEVQGEVNLSGQNGAATGKLWVADLAGASAALQPLLRDLGLLASQPAFSSGSATLTSSVTLHGFALEQMQAESAFSLRAASGQMHDYRFADVTVDARWRGIETWQTTAPVDIRIAQLDVGFDVENLQATLELPSATPWHTPALRINDFSADLFGGSARLPQPTVWDPGAASNAITLQIDNWQLAALVALQQNQELRASGVLEGTLPLTVESGRLIVEGGFVRAQPPGGVIQYTPDASGSALASGSEELALALDLLENFNYEFLRSDVALDKAGNLALGLALRGNNPDQRGGRPVQFNINLEQNIDPLLQSARTSDKLIESIERRHR